MASAESLPPGIDFRRPTRAARLLAEVGRVLPSNAFASLPLCLRRSPAPDDALDRLAALLAPDSGAPRERALRVLDENPEALPAAITLFSYSRFLAEAVIQSPARLEWALAPERYGQLMTAADLRAHLGWIDAGLEPEAAAGILARFKRSHLLRITLRDLLGQVSLAETTVELSNLADALLEGAREYLARRLVQRFGRPLVTADRGVLEGRFVVLALGKLGARELNYSSDIDLIYLHTGDGTTSGPIKISNSDFYRQLAQQLTQLLSQVTAEGFAYRVDLRLRPEGSAGELVSTLDGAVGYYNTRARDWELQMLIKARPAAGHSRLGEEFLRMVRSLIYRTTTDFSMVERISASRDRIARHLEQRGRPTVDVKLARGGIRDIEFLVQCLQRLYGGHDPFVRSGGTLFALHRLREKGYLSMPDYARLDSAYQFLRTVEHRLQLVDNRQTHELPNDELQFEILGRKMSRDLDGPLPVEDLAARIERHLGETREIYERVIRAHRPRATIASAGGPTAKADVAVIDTDQPIRSSTAWVRRFGQLSPQLREAIEALDLRRGTLLFEQFVEKIVALPSVLAALDRQPALLECVADLAEHSPYLGEHLVRYPEDVSELIPIVLPSDDPADSPLESTATLDARTEGLAGDSFAENSTALRVVYRRRMLAILADSVHHGRPIFATLTRTSDLAEWVVRRAYQIALERNAELTRTPAPSTPLQVVALGRLGMREFDLGSDADLVFVLPDQAGSDKQWWTHFVERFIEVISSYTSQGVIFSIDTRLRPRGRDGELVQTEAAYLRYFADGAEAWEALAYMKARTVAGDRRRGREFLESLQQVGWKRFGLDAHLADLLRGMRAKLEAEQAGSSPLKAGPGGYYDVDFILLFLRLRQAGTFFESLRTPERIDNLQKLGELDSEQAEFLRSSAVFFRALDHGIRTATGHANATIPADAKVQETLRDLLVRWGAVRPISRRLSADIDQMRTQTRDLFEQVFR